MPCSGKNATRRLPTTDSLAAVRAARLKVALTAYRLDHGKLPATLDQLVPDYLDAVPRDPFDEQPFRFRISTGEPIALADHRLPPVAVLKEGAVIVPAGQGILWSVGRGKTDNGGRSATGIHVRDDDLVFLVPQRTK